MFNKQKFFITTAILFQTVQSQAQSVKFNPEAPIYIEYRASEAKKDTEVPVQIEDATSPSKIRLSLQAKPESTSTYYGYLWLQLGKKMTNEVNFKRSKSNLKGWLTQQDGLQALFLFDDEKSLTDFKAKALTSKAPLADRKNLPQLLNPALPPVAPPKAIQIATSEMAEVSKIGELMAANNDVSESQKKVNEAKAAALSSAGLKNLQAKNYVAAEKSFEEALKLDPTNSMNRYYLGICYYQTKKYERSLALLSLAEGADYNYAEYKYYVGLNYLKLKNYSKATENLDDARDEKDIDYSPAAAFFGGHIYFQTENYNQARKNFEFTIDQSKDPKMDREAEVMLGKIDAIEGFRNQMKERFRYFIYLGFGYDSNVINISTENLATDLSAYRALYGTNLSYKLFYDMKHDLAIDFNASDYYSVNNKFKSDATVQTADPQILGVSLPYHRRFQYGKSVFTWGLLPGYQVLNMSLTGEGRKKIQDSTVIGTDLYWAVTETHFSKINFEYSMDHSQVAFTDPADDLTANRTTISTTQIFVTDANQKKMWLGDLGYVINPANGDNYNYKKAFAALTYSRAGFWNATNTARIDYAYAKYDQARTSRADKIATATLGLTKELNKNLSLSVSGLYTLSQSNVDTYKYNKFAVQTILSYGGAF